MGAIKRLVIGIVTIMTLFSSNTVYANSFDDYSSPLITELSIAEQGRTLVAGDTLNITVKITEESDISTCQIVFKNESSGATINASSSFLNQVSGTYIFSYKISDTMSNGKWILFSTFVGDKYNNFETQDTIPDKSEIYFYIDGNSSDTIEPIITDVSIAEHGRTLAAGDTLNITVKITEESDISTCQIVFKNELSDATINASSSFIHQESGTYNFSYTISDTMSNGKWVLYSTFVGDKYNNYGTQDTILDKSAIFFFVAEKTLDTKDPTITDVSILEQGKTLAAGDTLNITVKITEESDISTCQIVFKNELSDATINASSNFKHLESGTYNFNYTISDTMSNGKWVLYSTFVGDKYNNYGTQDTISDKSSVFFFVDQSNAQTDPNQRAILGDADGDDKVDITDATLIQKAVAELTELDANQKIAADVNCDNKVDITDATMIQKYVAEIIDHFGKE